MNFKKFISLCLILTLLPSFLLVAVSAINQGITEIEETEEGISVTESVYMEEDAGDFEINPPEPIESGIKLNYELDDMEDMPLGTMIQRDLRFVFSSTDGPELALTTNIGTIKDGIWTFTAEETGTYEVVITASDEEGRFLTESFIINVVDFEEKESGGFSVMGIQSGNDRPCLVDISISVPWTTIDPEDAKARLKAGDPVNIFLHFNRSVHYTSGHLKLGQGFNAEYMGGSGTNTLLFQAVIPDECTVPLNGEKLTISGWENVHIDDGVYVLSAPASISGYSVDKGERRNNRSFTQPFYMEYNPDDPYNLPLTGDLTGTTIQGQGLIYLADNTPPRIINIRTNKPSGTYSLGEMIFIILDFSEEVKRFGYEWTEARLNNGAFANRDFDHGYIRRANLTDDNGNFFRISTDTKYIMGFTVEPGHEIDGLKVEQIIGGYFEDFHGNRLDTALPDGDGSLYAYGDTKRELPPVNIEIVVPDGVGRVPYFIAYPAKSEEWTEIKQDVLPNVRFVSSSMYRFDVYRIWYYWDKNPSHEESIEKWNKIEQELTKNLGYGSPIPGPPEGILTTENGGWVLPPGGGNVAGEYYLHAVAVYQGAYYEKSIYHISAASGRHWTVGPFLFDEKAPEIDFITPASASEPIKTNQQVIVEILEPHSGLDTDNVFYQWRDEDGKIVSEDTFEKTEGNFHITYAPENSGNYQLYVQAEDNLGHRSSKLSGIYVVDENVQHEECEMVIKISGGSEIEHQKAISGKLDTANERIFIDISPAEDLGKVYFMFSDIESKPGVNNPAWVDIDDAVKDGIASYNDLNDERSYFLSMPQDLKTGIYYLHVKFYDKWGTPYIETLKNQNGEYNLPIYLDRRGPMVFVEPDGHGLSSDVRVKITVRDEMGGMEGAREPIVLLASTDDFDDDDFWSKSFYVEKDGLAELEDEKTLTMEFNIVEQTFGNWALEETPPLDGEYFIHVTAYDALYHYSDAKENESHYVSRPYYLDTKGPDLALEPEQNVTGINIARIRLDVGGEAGAEYSYCINQGEFVDEIPIPGELYTREVKEGTYYVGDTDKWSEWKPYEPVISIPLPEEERKHHITVRVRDSFGNVGRYDYDPHGDEPVYLPYKTTTVEYRKGAPVTTEPPKVRLEYSTLGWTNQDVTVTLKPVDTSVVITNNSGSYDRVFTENGTFTFEFVDSYGRKGTAVAAVTNIDKIPPNVHVSYSIPEEQLTNGNVRASIIADEKVQVIWGDGSTNNYYIFEDNGTASFTVTDRAGTTTQGVAKVSNIDRTPIDAEVKYDIAEEEGKMIVTISSHKEFVVLNDSNSGNYVYSKEKRYSFSNDESTTFILQDRAGNMETVYIEVSDIEPPKVMQIFSTEEPTRDNVMVTLVPDRDITIDGYDSLDIEITESGKHAFTMVDAKGFRYPLIIEVTNIDREAPRIEFETRDLLVLQNGNFDPMSGVKATDNLDGNITYNVEVNTGSLNTTKPGNYEIVYSVTDRAGNRAEVKRTVRVLKVDKLTALINSTLPDENGAVYLNTGNVRINFSGEKGETTVKWAQGEKDISFFKGLSGSGKDINGYSYGVMSGSEGTFERGKYTFYIEDQERQWLLIHLYING